MSDAEDRLCPFCGKVTFNTVAFGNQPPQPWCLNPGCAKKRTKAVVDFVKRNKASFLRKEGKADG